MTTPENILLIEGKPVRERLASRAALTMISGSIGIWLWRQADTTDEQGILLGVVAVIAWITAVAVLGTRYRYIDFHKRELVTVHHYAGLRTRRDIRPLRSFERIVVRHLCHNGGEGPDTYTGSIGLKSPHNAGVLWVKHFPTDEDELPACAWEFAQRLAHRTGIPFVPPMPLS